MYKALKPCKFAGKAYRIGEIIDEGAVIPTAAPRLIKSGMIVAVEWSGRAHTGIPTPECEVSIGEGSLLPSPSTIEKRYTESTLLRMTKKELLALAETDGVEATEEMKKEEIVELIIEKQGE